MKKHIAQLFMMVIALSFVSCSSEDDSNPEETIPDQNPAHSYTYTVTGNDIEGVSFIKEIPYEDHGGGMAYFEPENNYVMVSALHTNNNPGIRSNFVYLNDVIQPLAINESTNQNTSVIFVNFEHQGQNYNLESVSGQCTSHLLETFPFGITNSGKSTFKISFSGTFRNMTNHSQIFEVTEGNIEVYNN
ncbi:MAG: hypothetical protein ACSHXF_01335 [Aquaticitalea sp.]